MATELNSSLSRLFRAHQSSTSSAAAATTTTSTTTTDMTDKYSTSLPYYKHLLSSMDLLSSTNSPNSFSESWPKSTFNNHNHQHHHHQNNNRKQDDELQSLDWLLVRPCLPKMTPLDSEENSQYYRFMQNNYPGVIGGGGGGGGGGYSHNSLGPFSSSFPYNHQFHDYLSNSKSSSTSTGFLDTNGSGGAGANGNLPLPGNYYHSTDRNMEKPALSYSNLIFLAILSSPRQAMTVNQMYQWCEKTFPYYQDKTCGWKNSLRHNLSLNKGFQKVPKANGESGRGALWVIDPNQYQSMLDAVRKNPICMEILRQQQQQLHMMDATDSDVFNSAHDANGGQLDERLLHHHHHTLGYHHHSHSINNLSHRNGLMVKNGWADVADSSYHHHYHQFTLRVVPQNGYGGLPTSEDDDRDFLNMVDKMHYTKEQLMAYEKLTEEEREGIPPIETCPNLFKEMVTMKVEKKTGKKRRRKTGQMCVSFRPAPHLDHHYASHQMLLSHKANCMPCLAERGHDDMLWFGGEPLESQLFDDLESENNNDDDFNNVDTPIFRKKEKKSSTNRNNNNIGAGVGSGNHSTPRHRLSIRYNNNNNRKRPRASSSINIQNKKTNRTKTIPTTTIASDNDEENEAVDEEDNNNDDDVDEIEDKDDDDDEMESTFENEILTNVVGKRKRRRKRRNSLSSSSSPDYNEKPTLSAISAARLLLDVSKYREKVTIVTSSLTGKQEQLQQQHQFSATSRSRRKTPIFQRSMSPDEEDGNKRHGCNGLTGGIGGGRSGRRKGNLTTASSKKLQRSEISENNNNTKRRRKRDNHENEEEDDNDDQDVDEDDNDSLTEMTTNSLDQLMKRSTTTTTTKRKNVNSTTKAAAAATSCEQEVRNFKKLFRFQDSDDSNSLSPTKLNSATSNTATTTTTAKSN